jgi:hypothetical protein
MLKMNLLGSILTIALMAVACSSGSSNRNYQGAGSRWDVSFTDANFEMIQYANLSATEALQTIRGTYVKNATNGMLEMTVTEASGTGAPTVGAETVALEIEGTATFIKPFSGAIPVAAVVAGTCPTADFSANWIITKPNLDGGVFEQGNFDTDGFGTAVYTAASDRFLVRGAGISTGVLQAEVDGSAFDPIGMNTCQEGRLSVSQADENFDMYFTPSGQIVVKFPAAMGDQIIFGLPAESAAVTAQALEGTYSVFVYQGGDQDDLSTATLQAARLTFESGVGAIRLISDVENNTLAEVDLGLLTVLNVVDDSSDPLPAGSVRFTLDSGLTGEIACSAVTGSTPKTIACYGYTGTDPNREPITIVGHSVN